MNKRFLIYAPPYDSESGGSVVLHRLCSILNELGYEAYLSGEFVPTKFAYVSLRAWAAWLKQLVLGQEPHRTRMDFHTPILKKLPFTFASDWIVVYPEVVHGNPLRAANVVRWLLYRPGGHTGNLDFGAGELHVDFNEFARDFTFPGAHKAAEPLYVVSFPFDIFNLESALPPGQRQGTAYCLRKGKGKPMVHELEDSILIDGKSLEEIAAIFKRVKTFISYDPYTAFSSFAVLCGAESVVVPDAGVSRQQWYSSQTDRYGVAYGFDDLPWARATAGMLPGQLRAREHKSVASVRDFAEEAIGFFNSPGRQAEPVWRRLWKR